MTDEQSHRHIRSYVLRSGRVTNLQRKALSELSPRYCIPFTPRPLDLPGLFGGKPVILEIGFGAGMATARIAGERTQYGYLGIEVFEAGVGKALSEIARLDLDNFKIIRHDATEVVTRMIPPESLRGAHLFFPDPWPKKRHHKRRIAQPEFVAVLADRLTHDGYLYAVTDWWEYAEYMLDVFEGERLLENRYDRYAPRQTWRPQTRFEKKALAQGREIRELVFGRVERPVTRNG